MKEKRRISKKDPGYYIPLPYAMAIKRDFQQANTESILFDGMKLDLRVEGVVDPSVVVIAQHENSQHTLGYIPKGMIERVLGLMEHEEKILVTLERKNCDRLKNSLWICFDELPSLQELGLKL